MKFQRFQGFFISVKFNVRYKIGPCFGPCYVIQGVFRALLKMLGYTLFQEIQSLFIFLKMIDFIGSYESILREFGSVKYVVL